MNRQLDTAIFHDFYWFKEELVDFCRNNGLSTGGGKLEIIERIAHFLDTGEIVLIYTNTKKKSTSLAIITEDSLIEPNFICAEKHRLFF